MKKLFRWFSNQWLKIRLKYYVRYIKRASAREHRIYYILLDPNTRDVVVCDNNEYQTIKRAVKKQGGTMRDYTYAIANPWNQLK